jgi:hypothetical protein
MRDKGGLSASIFFLPINEIAQVLQGLIVHRESLKQEIFELTGISDLFRGATQAAETATAQRIKGNFGNLRLQPKQEPMQRFIRNVLRLKAEIISELFSPQTLQRMTGIEIDPQVIQLLRDDKTRGFRIDIETDSTVQPDAEQEKRQAIEFMDAMSNFLASSAQIGAQSPMVVPLLGEMITFATRRFKAGRNFEETVERTMQAIQEQAMQPPSPPQPDPDKVLDSQTKLQIAQLDNETKMAIAGLESKIDIMLENMKAESGAINNLLDVAAR